MPVHSPPLPPLGFFLVVTIVCQPLQDWHTLKTNRGLKDGCAGEAVAWYESERPGKRTTSTLLKPCFVASFFGLLCPGWLAECVSSSVFK